jgi:hypothetical protein
MAAGLALALVSATDVWTVGGYSFGGPEQTFALHSCS